MQTRFGRQFVKQHEKAPPNIKKAFDKRFKLFLDNPFSPALNNHALSGRFAGLRSINITGDWRAIFQEIDTREGPLVIFHFLGTHSELYGK